MLDLRPGLGKTEKMERKDEQEVVDEDNLFVFEAEEKSKCILEPVIPLNFFHNSMSIIPDPNKSTDAPILASETLGPQITVCISFSKMQKKYIFASDFQNT